MPPAYRTAAARSNRFNGNYLLIWIATIVVIGFFLFNITNSPIDLTTNFFIDDSFFYFETA